MCEACKKNKKNNPKSQEVEKIQIILLFWRRKRGVFKVVSRFFSPLTLIAYRRFGRTASLEHGVTTEKRAGGGGFRERRDTRRVFGGLADGAAVASPARDSRRRRGRRRVVTWSLSLARATTPTRLRPGGARRALGRPHHRRRRGRYTRGKTRSSSRQCPRRTYSQRAYIAGSQLAANDDGNIIARAAVSSSSSSRFFVGFSTRRSVQYNNIVFFSYGVFGCREFFFFRRFNLKLFFFSDHTFSPSVRVTAMVCL